MTPKERRERYFKICAANLTNMGLAYEGFPKLTDTFLCPFCRKQFGKDALQPPTKVTVEHCIPQSLGGSDGTSTLICQKCNNDMGAWYESHLSNRIKAEEFLAGISEDGLRGHVTIGEGTVRSNVKIQQDTSGSPTISVFFDKKRTHPKEWDVALRTLEARAASPLQMRITTELGYRLMNQRIALLRIGYLMAFREFGYSYILNSNLDVVRKQIMAPEEELIPYAYVIDLGKAAEHINRVAFVEAGDIRAILVRVRLTAGNMIVHKGIVLPGLEEDGANLYARLEHLRESGTSFKGRYTTYTSEIDRLGEPDMLMWAYVLWRQEFYPEPVREKT